MVALLQLCALHKRKTMWTMCCLKLLSLRLGTFLDVHSMRKGNDAVFCLSSCLPQACTRACTRLLTVIARLCHIGHAAEQEFHYVIMQSARMTTAGFTRN